MRARCFTNSAMRLHGMLSDVTYPLLSGTNVARDFVEFPSQLYEHWLEQPEILRRFARHHETGEPMPEALLARAARRAPASTRASRRSNIAASALVDLGASSLTRRRQDRRRRFRAGGAGAHRHAGRRSRCATARRISSISFRAKAIRPAITAISGPRFSTPTASRRSGDRRRFRSRRRAAAA